MIDLAKQTVVYQEMAAPRKKLYLKSSNGRSQLASSGNKQPPDTVPRSEYALPSEPTRKLPAIEVVGTNVAREPPKWTLKRLSSSKGLVIIR